MKQINFSWGRAPLSILCLFLLGLSPAFSQQLTITTADRDPNTAGHQQCENNDVNFQVTGLLIGQTVLGYQYSDDNGASWTAFGNAANTTTDNDQPIADGRRYRVEILDANTTNAFFRPGGNLGQGGNGTGLSPVTVDIMLNITNPAIVAPMMVCQDAPNITLTASANNDIDPNPGPRFTIASFTSGADACDPPTTPTLNNLTGILNLNEGFWGTVTVRARFQGCNANGDFRSNTSNLAATATSVITVKRTFEEIITCALDPTPTIITGPTAVCEGQTEKYTAFNPYAFPSPAGHTYEFSLDNPGAGVIATPNTASMTNITWTNLYTGGLIPVQVAATAWGCKNPGGLGDGFADWNATGVLPVFICDRPILKTLTADKTTTCEGECINFYVMFDFANGSDGPFIVNYTVNGVPQQTLIPANSNNALLTSICGIANYSVVITSVQNNNILELVPNGDGTFTSKFNNCTQTAPLPAAVNVTVIPNPKVLTLTGSPDEDVAAGVQKCEGGNITLTATAAGSMLLYTWTKNGTPVQGPSALATYTFPATLANPASLSEINAYAVIVEGKCDDPDSKTILVTIYKQPVGGTIAPALTRVCGAVPVTLNLTGQIGAVKKWQRQVNCAGPWIDIAATAGLTTFTFTTVPNTITCYRAVVGNGTCPDVFSTTARVEADAKAVGGIVTLANNMAVTMASICPNQNVVLKVSGYTGKILNWQSNPIISPVWVNIPGTTNNINLTVNGSSIATTTFFRACICSPLGICTGPDALAYSSAFKVSKKSNCAPPPPPAALVQNTDVPGNAVISKAFPIPTNHRVTLEIEGASEGDAKIEVIDLMGKVAIRETRFLQFGTNEVSFDISNLSNGIYIVKFMDSEKHQSSIKITKSN